MTITAEQARKTADDYKAGAEERKRQRQEAVREALVRITLSDDFWKPIEDAASRGWSQAMAKPGLARNSDHYEVECSERILQEALEGKGFKAKIVREGPTDLYFVQASW